MSLFQKKTDKPQSIELSQAHQKPRLILICVLIVIAAVAFATGVTSCLNGEPGWRAIEASTGEVNCGEDFVFQYFFPASNSAASKMSKQITALYGEAAEKAYWLFNADGTHEEIKNVAYLNRHPNETVEIDPVLYNALDLLTGGGNRLLYLAEVYSQYDNVFLSELDSEAAAWDPARSEENRDYVNQILLFSNDPAHVSLELLENYRVCLTVSDAYLAFADENEFTNFIDFHWTKNAFIVDYFAQLMIDAGYTDGYIGSYDGFTRNLMNKEEIFSFNVFDRIGNGIELVARMEYAEPMSIVFLRNYPMSNKDRWNYYIYADGTGATAYVDPTDGLSKTADTNLVSYATGHGCAEILMEMIPAYVTDTLDETALQSMAERQIYSIWCKDTTVCYNDPDLQLLDLLNGEDLQYTQSLVQGVPEF